MKNRTLVAIITLTALVTVSADAQQRNPGSSGGTPGGTNGQIQYNNSGTFGGYTIGSGLAVAAGSLTATAQTTGGTTVLNTSSLIETLPNDTSTGTVNNKLLVYTAAAKVKTAGTGDTSDVVGICVPGQTGTSCGTSGNASVAIAGQASCVFDGATTAGDFVVTSTTTAGDCHDAGSTVPATVQVLGYVLSTNASGGTYAVDISNIGAMAALNSKAQPGGSNGQLQINSSNKFGGITLGGDCTFSTPNITCTKTSGNNTAALSVQQSFTKGQAVTPVALTPGATVSVDASQSNNFTLTPAQNFTLANPTNLLAGQTLNFWITQDSIGSRVLTLGSDYQAASGVATIVLSTAPSTKDLVTCVSDTTTTLTCMLVKAIAH